jgi:hypothetical protein
VSWEFGLLQCHQAVKYNLISTSWWSPEIQLLLQGITKDWFLVSIFSSIFSKLPSARNSSTWTPCLSIATDDHDEYYWSPQCFNLLNLIYLNVPRYPMHRYNRKITAPHNQPGPEYPWNSFCHPSGSERPTALATWTASNFNITEKKQSSDQQKQEKIRR